MGRTGRVAIKSVVWVACLLPVACLLYWFWTDDLTANPIDFITDTLGDWSLRFLLASLTLTPLRLVTGMAWQMTLRRLLGLFAFFYVALHFGVWIALVKPSLGLTIVRTNNPDRRILTSIGFAF